MRLQLLQKWKVTYRDPDPSKDWSWEGKNLIPNQWLNALLNGTVSYANPIYIMLVDNSGWTAFAASDTAASHPGWTEFTNYSETARQVATLSTSTAQSRDNTASPATFTFLGAGTLKGAALSTSNVKSGTAGVLAGEVAFGGGNQTVSGGGTLDVEITITAASA